MNLTKLRAAVARIEASVGCGDHSCLYVQPMGMGTNGGCRCPGERHEPGGRMLALDMAVLFKTARELVASSPPEDEPTCPRCRTIVPAGNMLEFCGMCGFVFPVVKPCDRCGDRDPVACTAHVGCDHSLCGTCGHTLPPDPK